MSCDVCHNTRKKTYEHESGRKLCYRHLRETALEGRKDFRHKSNTASDELSEREPDDTQMIDSAPLDELMGMQRTLTDEINRRRRLLNSVRKRIIQLGTAAAQQETGSKE